MANRSKILYVEDDDGWSKFITSCLDEYDVEIASTRSDGLARLKSDMHYDLALVNLNLDSAMVGNDMGGVDILEYIRDNRPNLPRIVLSGISLAQLFKGTVVSGFVQKYQVAEMFPKDQFFQGNQFRKIVRELLERKSEVLVKQLHTEIPKYIVHHYRRERLGLYPGAQLFEFIIEGPTSGVLEIFVEFQQQQPYIQKTKHLHTLEPGKNKLHLSPLFTGQVGDGAEIAVSDIQVLAGSECLWRSSESYFFQVVDTVPILLKEMAQGDGWMHFLVATCITPHSAGVNELSGQTRDVWKQQHQGEVWRASDYTPADALEMARYLRNLLKERLLAEGHDIPDTPESQAVVKHKMRLPDEILASRGANCLYYSLIYASIVENLSIQPLLLFMPGHVIPGWKKERSSPDDSGLYMFEPGNFGFLNEQCVFVESTKTSDDTVTFEEMIEAGNRAFRNAQKLYARNRQPSYLLDVAQLRREGFHPYGASVTSR